MASAGVGSLFDWQSVALSASRHARKTIGFGPYKRGRHESQIYVRELSMALGGIGSGLWDGSVVLSRWIYAHRDLFSGRSVLELGSGCGLPGILAARYARRAWLTEYIPMLVDNLNYNIAVNSKQEDDEDRDAIEAENKQLAAMGIPPVNLDLRPIATACYLDWFAALEPSKSTSSLATCIDATCTDDMCGEATCTDDSCSETTCSDDGEHGPGASSDASIDMSCNDVACTDITCNDITHDNVSPSSATCTRVTQSTRFATQLWRHCRTCFPRDTSSGACVTCAATCHIGHDLAPWEESRFRCDCDGHVCGGSPAQSPSAPSTVSANQEADNIGTVDIILGAELTYNCASVDALAAVVAKYLKPDGVFYEVLSDDREGVAEFIEYERGKKGERNRRQKGLKGAYNGL